MKKNKKIITEQSVGTCNVWKSANFKLMCESGCFKEGTFPDTYNTQQVAKVKSSKYPGYYAVYFDDYKQENGGCTVKFFSGETYDKPLIRTGTKEALSLTANCANMNETLAASTSPDIKKVLLSISAYTKGQVVSYETIYNNTDLISQGWELIPLTKAPGYDTWSNRIGGQLKARPEMIMVWKKSGAKQYQGNNSEACIKTYSDLGYIVTEKPTIPEAGFDYKNLQAVPGCSEHFATEYWMKLDLTKLSDGDLINKINTDYNALTKSGLTKSTCRSFINSYFTAYDDKTAINQTNLNLYKKVILSCDNRFNFVFLEKELEKLKYAKTIKTSTGEVLDYSTNADRKIQNEPEQNEPETMKKLKTSIRENLNKIKENKKRVISEDTEIVKKRLSMLTENRLIVTKRDEKRFFNDLIKEISILNSKGYDKKVINEQLIDLLKTIFSKAPEAIQQIFKEHFADWVISKLLPNKKDTFLAKLISTSFANLDISDITKLTDCSFLSKFMSKNIVETLGRQALSKAGAEGFFYDGIRQAAIESLEDSNFGQKIESLIADNICVSLPKIKEKMTQAADKIKSSAIDGMKKTNLLPSAG